MLVLGRKIGEKIFLTIGDEEHVIEVMLLECRGSMAKLGFVASENVKIEREELRNHRIVGRKKEAR
jgi:carbon storage regulator CsrA